MWPLPLMLVTILCHTVNITVIGAGNIGERSAVSFVLSGRSIETQSAVACALHTLGTSFTIHASPGPVHQYQLPLFSLPLADLKVNLTLWNGSALPGDSPFILWPDYTFTVQAGQEHVGTWDLLFHAVPRSYCGGSNSEVSAQACVRVIVKESLDLVPYTATVAPEMNCPRPTMLTTARQPPAADNQPLRATVSSLVVHVEQGKELRYDLPDDLFIVPEDGVRHDFKLRLVTSDSESHSPTVTDASPSSQLQLVSSQGERWYLSGLYLGPVSHPTVLYYVLRATDREGAYADVNVQVNITEPPVLPAFVLRAELTVGVISFSNNISRQLEFFRRIMHVAGDTTTANVSLLEVRHSLQSSTPSAQHSQYSPQHATKLSVTWTHTGVAPAAGTSACPVEAILSLARLFMINKTITSAASDKERGLGSFGVISIELEPRQHCLNKVANEVAFLPVVAPAVPGHESMNKWAVFIIVIIPVILVVCVVATVLLSRRSEHAVVGKTDHDQCSRRTSITMTVSTAGDKCDDMSDGSELMCSTSLMQGTATAPPSPSLHLHASWVYLQPLMVQQPNADGGSPVAGIDAMPPYQPQTSPIRHPDESRAVYSSAAQMLGNHQQTQQPPQQQQHDQQHQPAQGVQGNYPCS